MVSGAALGVSAYMETNSTPRCSRDRAVRSSGSLPSPSFVARWHDDLVEVSDAVAAHDGG